MLYTTGINMCVHKVLLRRTQARHRDGVHAGRQAHPGGNEAQHWIHHGSRDIFGYSFMKMRHPPSWERWLGERSQKSGSQPMGKFISSDFQTTRERPTPATLSYLGAGLLLAAEAHSVICSPFSETSFLPQLSDTDHSFLCSAVISTLLGSALPGEVSRMPPFTPAARLHDRPPP